MKKIKVILLAMAMVATLSGLAVAQNRDYRDDNRAQGQNDDYRGNHREDNNYRWGRDRNNDAREYGYHNGYRAGWSQGRTIRTSRGRYGNWNNGGWGSSNGAQSDTSGYQRWMGPQGQYKQGYREGYRSGYSDAYHNRRAQTTTIYGQGGRPTPWDPDGDGVPGVSNSGGYYGGSGQYGGQNGNGSAQRFGFQDGQQLGQRDRASGHSYRPTEWQAYKDADHGMSASNGYRNSDQYKQEYRQAFMNGYNQGFGRR
ncbi:MAG: hypothetical protein M3P27_10710 [Acidobacteriota bacterium]|nr:hypothetical protein [Acidobacteriota bacterium]